MRRSNWGRACWIAIHGLACCLPDTPENTAWLLASFRSIIAVLPCAECRAHARLLSSSQSHPVADMPSLKVALFQFHNVVNRRKRLPDFPWEMYVSVHAQGSIRAKLNSFLRNMLLSGRGRRDFMAGMTRAKTCKRFVEEATKRLEAPPVTADPWA